ncbi:MAG: L,D-transpeptidase family protein [Planctomycetes bacterium]|nr:L,D-transpeptidase family protein [Planctomycetota bacterium]
MLEDLFERSKDRADLDLSAEVLRLLGVERRLEKRREYVQYLARRDRTGRVVQDLLARAQEDARRADDDADAAVAAWDGFTLAHEASVGPEERRAVLAHLAPFLERHIYSGRHSPLLKTHTVKSGDSLFTIAAEHKTTLDSIKRLNRLKSDTIQPRQRLRVLEGKVRIVVDKSEFALWATIDGRLLFDLPVGLGRDNGTPSGAFVIRVRQKDPAWWRPGEAPLPAGDPGNILGTRWLGFEETRELSGYGIHGTQDPSTVGTESSAGCIRLRNEDIELLFDFVPYGTEVAIRP